MILQAVSTSKWGNLGLVEPPTSPTRYTNMERKNHPIEKEDHLNQTSIVVGFVSPFGTCCGCNQFLIERQVVTQCEEEIACL